MVMIVMKKGFVIVTVSVLVIVVEVVGIIRANLRNLSS